MSAKYRIYQQPDGLWEGLMRELTFQCEACKWRETVAVPEAMSTVEAIRYGLINSGPRECRHCGLIGSKRWWLVDDSPRAKAVKVLDAPRKEKAS